jgi:hypothetical protein
MRTTSRRPSAARFVLEGIEGADQTAAEVDIDADEQHGDGADAALLDMQGAVGESDDNDAAVDELENTVAALESLLETAEASQETGGLDPVAAELLQKAVDNETAPLGTPAEEVVPALENFQSPGGRRQATVMACEGIKSWIDSVWKKIQEMIQKGRELMKKAWVFVKQSVQRLEQRVASLKADAAKRNGSMPKAGNYEGDSAWKVDAAGVKRLGDFVNDVLGTYATGAIAHANAVASALSAGDAAKAAAEGGEKPAEGAEPAKEEFVIPKGLQATVQKVTGAANLPGGRKAVLAGDTIVIKTAQSTESGKSASKPASLSDIEAILTGLEAIAKQVVGFEKNFQAKDAAESNVLKAGSSFASKVKSNDKTTDPEARAALNTAKNAARLLNQPIKDTLGYAATAINGICGFVAGNLKMYDKK